MRAKKILGTALILLLFTLAFRAQLPALSTVLVVDHKGRNLLILPFLGLMLWSVRKELSSAVVYSLPRAGLLLLGIGCVLNRIPPLAYYEFFTEISPFVGVTGIFLIFRGGRWTLTVIPSLAYLITMLSLVDRFASRIKPLLQLSSAIAAQAMLLVLGRDVERAGVDLILPASILEVAPGCSGAEQLISIVGMSFPFAFLRHRRAIARAAMLCSAVPITVVTNGIRIMCIGLWNYATPRVSIHGPGEILLSPLVMPLTLVILLLFSRGLSLLEKKYARKSTVFPPDFRPAGKPGYAVWVAVVMLAVSAVFPSYPRGRSGVSNNQRRHTVSDLYSEEDREQASKSVAAIERQRNGQRR